MIFGFIDKEVQLGLNTSGRSIPDELVHGVATVVSGNRRPAIQFTASHPNRLKHPSNWAITKMFAQVESLGYQVESLELRHKSTRRVYRMTSQGPELVQYSRV